MHSNWNCKCFLIGGNHFCCFLIGSNPTPSSFARIFWTGWSLLSHWRSTKFIGNVFFHSAAVAAVGKSSYSIVAMSQTSINSTWTRSKNTNDFIHSSVIHHHKFCFFAISIPLYSVIISIFFHYNHHHDHHCHHHDHHHLDGHHVNWSGGVWDPLRREV